MMESNVLTALKFLKNKNCKGHDCIPLRILFDGTQFLLKPLSLLFNKIYTTTKNSRTMANITNFTNPQKGLTKNVENYRSLASLCSCPKIFEKLILNRIRNIETENKLDIIDKSQHGIKPKHSTLTASQKLQSLISRAAE